MYWIVRPRFESARFLFSYGEFGDMYECTNKLNKLDLNPESLSLQLNYEYVLI